MGCHNTIQNESERTSQDLTQNRRERTLKDTEKLLGKKKMKRTNFSLTELPVFCSVFCLKKKNEGEKKLSQVDGT